MKEVNDLIRVLLVDDHPVIRDGMRQYIDSERDLQVVGEACDGAEAVQQFLSLSPDVVLMDLQMPGVGGLDAISAIRSHSPHAAIVVLTTYPGDVRASRALALGATSYLLKLASPETIISALRSSLHGKRVVADSIADELNENRFSDELSPREQAVLQLIALGNTNHEIGKELGISEQTVKTHVRNVLEKLGARDRTQALAIARRRGFLEP